MFCPGLEVWGKQFSKLIPLHFNLSSSSYVRTETSNLVIRSSQVIIIWHLVKKTPERETSTSMPKLCGMAGSGLSSKNVRSATCTNITSRKSSITSNKILYEVTRIITDITEDNNSSDATVDIVIQLSDNEIPTVPDSQSLKRVHSPTLIS